MNVRMIVYKLQVRLRESLWSSLWVSKSDVNKWAKLCVW